METFREGGLAALIQTREQRGVMARLQSAMAVVEGHSEHVMDALGEELIPDLDALRAAMQRRRRTPLGAGAGGRAPAGARPEAAPSTSRARPSATRLWQQGGVEMLNQVWREPAALPDERELRDPAAWIERVAQPAAA